MNASEDKAKPADKGEKQKALCVATRCTSIEQFVATFHRFCDESSFFVATLATRPVGLETAFSIQLEDKTPVLRGLCVVVEAWSTPANRFGRPGVRLDVRRLTNESLEVFKMLQAAREAAAAHDANAAANSLAAAMAEAATKAEAAVKAEEKQAEEKKAEAKKTETGKIEVTKFARASEPSMDPPKLPRSTRDGLPPMPPTRTPATGIPPIASSAKGGGGAPPEALGRSIAKPATPTQPMPRLATPPKGIPPTIEPAKLRAEGTAPVGPTPPPASRAVNTVTQQMPPVTAQRNVPAVGIVTSSIAHSNAADTAEVTNESPAYPEPGKTGETKLEAKSAEKPDPKSELRKKLEGLSKLEGKPKLDAKAEVKPSEAKPVDAKPEPKVVINPGAPKSADAGQSRAPGSAYVLPANPLMNLTDSSLEGFIDCALYEETANFFRAPDYEDSLVDIGELATPPLAPVSALRPGEASGQNPPSYVGPLPEPPAAPQVMFHGASRTTPPPFDATGRTTPPPFNTHDMQTGPMQPLDLSGNTTPPPFDVTGRTTPPPFGRDMQTGPMQPLTPTGQMQPYLSDGAQTPAMGHALSPLAFTPQQEASQPFIPRSDATPIPMLIGQNGHGAAPAYPTMTPFPPAAHVVQAPPYPERQRRTAITNIPRSRRGLVIGGSAAGALLLIIVIAAAAGGGDEPSAATTKPVTKATPSKTEPSGAKVAAVDKSAETKPATVDKAASSAIATTNAPRPTGAETRTPEPEPTEPTDEVDERDSGPQIVGRGPCQIQIATTPAGSIVRIDDQKVGPSPITIAGPCKRTKVDAKHPRYAAATKWVTPVEGTPAVVDMPMSRPTHSVMITSNPAGATVSIGGRRAGTTPTSVKLMGFTTQSLTFEKKGYAKVTQKLYSKIENDRVTVKLTRTK